jgi:hypothetical protein
MIEAEARGIFADFNQWISYQQKKPNVAIYVELWK